MTIAPLNSQASIILNLSSCRVPIAPILQSLLRAELLPAAGAKKRTQTAIETWCHAKKLKPDEQVRRDRASNRIWVCSRCSWESASLTSARNHLDQMHSIKIKAQQPQVITKGQAKLEQILRRQGEKQQAQADEREQKMLRNAINQKGLRRISTAAYRLPQLRGSHGGQHQAEYVNGIIDWYEIAHKLGYYIGDNHGSNDKCCRFILRHLREQYRVNWEPKTRRIRCHGHIINLASQAFIFADKETIDAVVKEIRQEAESGDEDDLNGSSDEGIEYDEEVRLSALSKKKKLSWKDIGPLGKLHAIVAYMRASELL
ncbi:hypothetical protein MPH_04117 [Macrophomina phaseolina MS6]|uniref:Uncharacterized protein n=1 Tax=Macrophomina phaseolina (strain MS6) TaxID=1126212 RepID=K2S8B4_MACPH|nr:hypothetical protein MPH_04117 [Macrophomina phaseolina MS6]